jgi:hypothetical protein
MSNKFKSAKRRNFPHGGAEIIHFAMRVFAMLAFRAVAGKFHPQFRRHVLICQREREAVGQVMEGTHGKHLIAPALHRL